MSVSRDVGRKGQQSTGVPFLGHGFGVRGLRGRAGRGLASAATYLGMGETTLRSELKSGKTLAEIATSTPGKTLAGLKAAIIAAATTRLNAAVSSGRITAQQEHERLAALSTRSEAMLQRTWSGPNGSRALGSPGH